jgi:hypothetical protein
MTADQEEKMNVIVAGGVTMDWNLAAGWQYDPVTDKDKKTACRPGSLGGTILYSEGQGHRFCARQSRNTC